MTYWRFAVVVCACLMAVGCADVRSREPFGEPVRLDDRQSAAAEMLDTLYSRLWLVENKEGMGVLRFAGMKNDRSVLKTTYLSEEDDPNQKEQDGKEQVYVCLMKAWDGRLILNLIDEDAKDAKGETLGKYSGLYLLWFEKDEAGNLWACGVEPSSEELKKMRKGADGKEVKLELVEAPRKGGGGGVFTITSSEAQIRAYLAACKPEDVYKVRDGARKDHRFAKAAAVNMNYQGRPEFRKRVDVNEEAATQPGR